MTIDETVDYITGHSPFIVTRDVRTNEVSFWHNTELNCPCRVIAPIRFTIQGEHVDDMGQTHNYLHENTIGFIAVTKDYAAVCFQDPDEMAVYTVHDPIKLGD